MSNFLLYLTKSTVCLTLLYLVFLIVMRKERFYGITRMLLLTIVLLSAAIPFIQLPLPMQSPVRVELPTVFAPVEAVREAISPTSSSLTERASTEMPSTPTTIVNQAMPSIPQLLFYAYLGGCLIAMLVLLRNLASVLLLTRKARSIPMDGFRLLVVDREIPAFSLGRLVVLSQSDYDHHRLPVLTHEQAHILMYHFFDLLLLEVAKIIYWFNPVIYWMAKDLKEIHEFQADDYTLTNGIDATQYQLLIIQKGVGSQRFALANSFNHCQIKKRIAMINQPKSGKAWSWKLVTFLPLLALLLMAFGRKEENGPPDSSVLSSVERVFTEEASKPLSTSYLQSTVDLNAKGLPSSLGLASVVQPNAKKTNKQWSEADFLSIDGLNDMIKMGKIPNWTKPDSVSIKQKGKLVTLKRPYFQGFVFCGVQIDSRSQLWMSTRLRPLEWSEFQDSIRIYVDYGFANEKSKPYFHSVTINGVEKMSPQCIFTIVSDDSTPANDYQKFLNNIGNTVLEIRKKYAIEIYKTDYSQLKSDQKEQIDIVVPLIARFAKTPKVRPKAVFDQNSLYIEIKAEGIIVSHETKTSSLEELQNKVELFLKENRMGMISVLTASSSKEEQLEEVKDVLHNAKASNVNYSVFDPIYQANYVDEKPYFSDGNWISERLKSLVAGKSKGLKVQISYSLVIESSGKVADVEITRGCEFPEINEAFKKILSDMPEWKPGKKNGVAVRVILHQASMVVSI